MVSIEHLDTPAFLVDVLPGGAFIYRDGNRPLTERTGLGRRLRRGLSPGDLLPAPFAAAVTAHYEACVRSGAVLVFEERLDGEGGSSHWRTTLIPIHDAGERRVTALLGIVVDITASKRAELDLLRANMRLALALQAVQGTHWEYDVREHRFEASPTLALLLGEGVPRPIGLEEWVQRIVPADRQTASFHGLVDGSQTEQVARFRVAAAAGEERWLKCRRLASRDAGGAVQFVFGVTVDVTDEVRREQRLVREAQRDGLTRLLNRRAFLKRLDAAVRDGEAGGGSLTVLMLDLDSFKAINDTLGHAAGDAVLVAVGHRIQPLLREADCAARLGGDEFVVAVRHRTFVRVRQLVDRLRHAIGQPCRFRDSDIPVGVSIGEARWERGCTASDLLETADRQLYAEKRHKRAARRPEVLPLRRRA